MSIIKKQYYELHITMLGVPNLVKQVVEQIGWKFSCIDGDPTLGEGVKCYATTHLHSSLSLKEVKHFLNIATENLEIYSAAECITVLRKKVEFVVYDELIKVLH